MHKYVIYGLGIHSELPLWGDGRARCARTVTVRWQRVDSTAAALDDFDCDGDADAIVLRWPDVSMAVVSGNEIILRAPVDAEVSHLRHLVSGIGLGLLLFQRGIFTLHAGAVAIGGAGLAIVGAKGAGKSTLVAALTRRGHQMISDDVVAIDLCHDTSPYVRVGPGNVNLWPDSAEATGQDVSALSRIGTRSLKLTGVIGPQSPGDVPLRAILVLSNDPNGDAIRRLGSVDALPHLVAHCHAFRWLAGPPDLARHLDQCRSVLGKVPVFLVNRGESLTSLVTLTDQVEQFVASLAPGNSNAPGALAGIASMDRVETGAAI